jgi:hypothetical protein
MQGNGKSAGARTFRSVLADLDDAFALAPWRTRIESCPCCTTAEEIAVLLSKPRKLLSANKLQGYAASSMTTIGSAQDLRYFTPRILEAYS